MASNHSPAIVAKSFSSALALLLLLTPALSFGAKECYQHYRQKKFAKAAECFRKQAKALGSPANEVQKFKKGRLLRNAMLCLDKAAKSADTAKAAYLREVAISVFLSYRRQKLYERQSQLDRTARLISDMRNQIQYGKLTLVSNHPRAKSCIEGYKYKKCNTAQVWEISLRPGPYKLTVAYPTDPPITKKREIDLKPSAKQAAIFNPPIKKQGRLTVITGHPRARIELSSDKLKEPKIQIGAFWVQTLTPGSYTVKVTYPKSKPVTKTFDVVGGRSKSYLLNPPPPPTLIVDSTPKGGRVYIDGKYIGKTPLKQKMEAGSYSIEVQKGCYLTANKKVSVEGKSLKVELQLTRDPVFLGWEKKKRSAGTLKILGWAGIIGGVVLGGATGLFYFLAESNHASAIRVRPDSFEDYSSAASTGNTFRTMGHVGIGVSAAAVGVGVFGFANGNVSSQYQLACKNPMVQWRVE